MKNKIYYLLISAIMIAESLSAQTSGKVGIGTATPTEKLDVNGNVVVNGNVRVRNNYVWQQYDNSNNLVDLFQLNDQNDFHIGDCSPSMNSMNLCLPQNGFDFHSSSLNRDIFHVSRDGYVSLSGAVVEQPDPNPIIINASFTGSINLSNYPLHEIHVVDGAPEPVVITEFITATPMEGRIDELLIYWDKTTDGTLDIDLWNAMTQEAWVQPMSIGGWRTVTIKEAAGGLFYALYPTNEQDMWSKNGNFVTSTDNKIGSVNPSSISLMTDNIGRIEITADGKIGINNPNPQSALDIKTDGSFLGGLRIFSPSGDGSFMNFTDDSGKGWIAGMAWPNYEFVFGTKDDQGNYTLRMDLSSNGDLHVEKGIDCGGAFLVHDNAHCEEELEVDNNTTLNGGLIFPLSPNQILIDDNFNGTLIIPDNHVMQQVIIAPTVENVHITSITFTEPPVAGQVNTIQLIREPGNPNDIHLSFENYDSPYGPGNITTSNGRAFGDIMTPATAFVEVQISVPQISPLQVQLNIWGDTNADNDWNTGGNSGTNSSNNKIGTLDFSDLHIITNDLDAIVIDDDQTVDFSANVWFNQDGSIAGDLNVDHNCDFGTDENSLVDIKGDCHIGDAGVVDGNFQVVGEAVVGECHVTGNAVMDFICTVGDDLEVGGDATVDQDCTLGTDENNLVEIKGDCIIGDDADVDGTLSVQSLSPNTVVLTDANKNLISGTINAANIDAGCITAAALAPSCVANINLDNDAVTTDKILDGTITGSDISGAGTIGYNQMYLTGSIQASDLAPNISLGYIYLDLTDGITNSDINSSAAIDYLKLNLISSITNADISSSANIDLSKLNDAGFSTNQIVKFNGTDFSAGPAVIKVTTTYDVTSVAPMSFSTQTFTVSGATTSGAISLSPGSALGNLIIASARISAANTLSITFYNPTGGAVDPAAMSWNVSVTQ